MDTNIILEYVEFVRRELVKFFKLVLGDNYDKKVVTTLIDKYLEVRYFNETSYVTETDFIERISKELKKLIKPAMNDENESQLKSIYSLFSYVFYFDDCYYVENETDLINYFLKDKNLKLEYGDAQKASIKKFLKNLRAFKDKFYDVVNSNSFFVEEKRLKKNVYKLSLGQSVKISKLYSEYAIEKTYNSGIINEDKLFVLLIMASKLLLQNASSLDFSRYYVIDLSTTLFSKEKKILRVFNTVDNPLAKKHLMFNVSYEDYLLNKVKIEKLIKEGFNFAVTINETFDEYYAHFILFSHVFLYEDSEFYDMIIENKNRIQSVLIVL